MAAAVVAAAAGAPLCGVLLVQVGAGVALELMVGLEVPEVLRGAIRARLVRQLEAVLAGRLTLHRGA